MKSEKTKIFKLLPCPFCGGPAEVKPEITGREWYHVVCNNVKCDCPMVAGMPRWRASIQEAVEDWNRRFCRRQEADSRMEGQQPVFREQESVMAVDYADGTGEMKKIKYADWLCPSCGWFVGERYLPRMHSQQKSDYCSRCGQAIDWTKITKEERDAAKKRMEELNASNPLYHKKQRGV